MTTEPHLPGIELVEPEAEAVVREVGVMLEHVRDLLRQAQDVEAKMEAEPERAGGYAALHARVAHELRVARRQLQRAHAGLVHEKSDRYAAAQRELRWIDEAEKEDRPWRAEAA